MLLIFPQPFIKYYNLLSLPVGIFKLKEYDQLSYVKFPNGIE